MKIGETLILTFTAKIFIFITNEYSIITIDGFRKQWLRKSRGEKCDSAGMVRKRKHLRDDALRCEPIPPIFGE
jgi:hypothetical protein